MNKANIAKKATAVVLAVVMIMSITALSFAITKANSDVSGISASAGEDNGNLISNAITDSLLSAHRKREK